MFFGSAPSNQKEALCVYFKITFFLYQKDLIKILRDSLQLGKNKTPENEKFSEKILKLKFHENRGAVKRVFFRFSGYNGIIIADFVSGSTCSGQARIAGPLFHAFILNSAKLRRPR